MELLQRSRRLRGSEVLRRMVRETRVDASSLIYPMFVVEGAGIKEEISSMPGQYRWSLDRLPEKLEELQKAGVGSFMLFGVPRDKDEFASSAYDENGIVQRAVRLCKERAPELYCITDVCLCEYTSHGHCGVLKDREVDNDPSVDILALTAVSHAAAGADMVAPSDMMDGRVLGIRTALDFADFKTVPIMAYSVKYASGFYGPFREAADSAPAFGDRRAYQMDVHNRREAVKKALQDVEQGADIVMVKPALSFLDVVREVHDTVNVPVAAYSVSGEYALCKAAAERGWIDEKRIVGEMATSAYRAGAHIYLTYYAELVAQLIDEGIVG